MDEKQQKKHHKYSQSINKSSVERVKKQTKDHLQFNRALLKEKRELIQNSHQHRCHHIVLPSPFSLRKVKNHYTVAVSEYLEMLLYNREVQEAVLW